MRYPSAGVSEELPANLRPFDRARAGYGGGGLDSRNVLVVCVGRLCCTVGGFVKGSETLCLVPRLVRALRGFFGIVCDVSSSVGRGWGRGGLSR